MESRDVARLIWGLFIVLVITLLAGLVRDNDFNYSLIITTLSGLIGTALGASKLLGGKRDEDEEP